jgi:hypothetical protein
MLLLRCIIKSIAFGILPMDEIKIGDRRNYDGTIYKIIAFTDTAICFAQYQGQQVWANRQWAELNAKTI